MVLSLLPLAVVAGAQAVPWALPPSPLSEIEQAAEGGKVDLSTVTIEDALQGPAWDTGAVPLLGETDEGAGPVQGALPLADTPQGAEPVGELDVHGAIVDYLVGEGARAEDVGLPILDFLEMYPQFKDEAAKRTGIRALMADDYDFTSEERTLITSRIVLANYKSSVAPRLYSHAELLAAQGIRAPLATAPLLVIDDDGSENNGGPGDTNAALEFPFTNQTAMMTESLTNLTVPFDLYVRPYGGTMPDFQTLTSYDQIIYVTGQNYAGLGGVTFDRRLTAYLDAEGDMWFIGEFLPFALDGLLFGGDNATLPTLNELMLDYMGIESYAQSGSADPMAGTAQSYLSGQSYDLNGWIPSNLTFTLPTLDFGYSLNYTSSVSQAVTVGSSVNYDSAAWSNVVGHLRTKFASKGVVITSTFEFSYLLDGAQRDDFVNRTYLNLSATPGLIYDTGSDISPVDASIFPNIDALSFDGFRVYDANGAFAGYWIFFAGFIEVHKPATVNLTIDNYRNATFDADPKIVMEQGNNGSTGTGSRVENSTLFNTVTIPAHSSFNISFTFTPHRMWNQLIHGIAAASMFDSVTTNNDIYLGTIGVAGFYDGAETLRPDVVVNGFTRVNNPAASVEGNWHWFTGSGNNLNNTLTLPWVDVRCLNSTAQLPDTGPCATRSQTLIWDTLYLVFFINGSVTAPDALTVETRSDRTMTWSTVLSSSISTMGGYTYYGSGGFVNAIFAWGIRIPQNVTDQFLQIQFRYTTGGASSSTGFKIDGIGFYAMKELNNRPDFVPLFTNAIVPPSPSYTVWSAGQPIASGTVAGIIEINETETVTVRSGIADTHRDRFTYNWSQSVAGFATLPANSTGSVLNAAFSFNVTTALPSFEAICQANLAPITSCAASGGNVATITLRATDEFGLVNTTTWQIKVRDARPTYQGPASFEVAEDSTNCTAATGPFAWFADPEGDIVQPGTLSPSVNGSRTVTVWDNTSIDGTMCLEASSRDWHGLTNLTITGTDPKGSFVTIMVNVTVLPVNDPPRIPVVVAPVGEQNKYISVNVTLFDIDNVQSSLTYNVTTNPPGKWSEQRNATNNLQLYNVFPDNSMVGRNYINVTICDPLSACVDVSFYVDITNVNDPPSFVTTGETRTVDQGQRFQLQVVASDPDDLIPNAPGTQFRFSDDTLLFNIDPASGMIDFTPTNAQVGSWDVLLTVMDEAGSSRQLPITFVVNNVNDAPTLPSYQDLNVTQDLTVTPPLIRGTDPDLALSPAVTEALTYTDDSALFDIVRVDTNVPGSPPEQSGRITITATNAQVGDWVVHVTVTDLAGASDTIEFHIRVNNVNDQPTNVRVNITDGAGNTVPVPGAGTRVSFNEGDTLTITVTADDPDLQFRVNDPLVRVDPTERLTCTMPNPGFSSELLITPPGAPVKPEINPDTCVSIFEPGNNEVGTFSITVTVRDQGLLSVNYNFRLQILNINQEPTNVEVVRPLPGFSVEPTGTLQLQGTATDIDTPDSLLTFSWTVTVEGGRTVTGSGRQTTVSISNDASADRTVTVTLKVTDNADALNPKEVYQNATGTIKGKPVVGGGLGDPVMLGLLGAVIAAAAVGGFLVMRRRKGGGPEQPRAPRGAPQAGPAQTQVYDQAGDQQQYDYSQGEYAQDQQYDYSQGEYQQDPQYGYPPEQQQGYDYPPQDAPPQGQGPQRGPRR